MRSTIMAFAIATFIAVTGTAQAGGNGNLSNNYSFKAGHGRVPWLMVYDHGDYVARDFNGDNTLDVMGLPSTHGSHKVLNEVSWHRGFAFLSAGGGKYKFVRTGARINNTATEWVGDYIAKGPIVVGNGPGGGPSDSQNGGGNAVTEPHPGCMAQCGVNRALIFNGLNTVLGPRFPWHGSTLADINKDGKLDLIAFSAGTTIYLGGNGPGGFLPGPYGRHTGNGEYVDLGAWSGNTGAFSGTFIDLDGDGYPEMITGSGAYYSNRSKKPVGSVTVWKNNGGKSFTPYQEFMRPTVNGTRAMWVNDGDVLVYGACGDRCTENNSISVYSNSGGKLHLKQHFNITSDRGKRGHPPRLVDVNGDGKKDLVVIHYDSTVAEQYRGIWLNNGNGTFSQLGTPLFNGVQKAGMKGVVIPTKANGDNRIDWIVVYQDGTFGTLLAPGGGNGGGNGGGGGNSNGGAYSEYVRGNGDLFAAYNNNSMGMSMEEWGRWHWNAYGKNEPNRKAKPNTTSNRIPRIRVDDIISGHPAEGGDRFWQLSFVKDKLNIMSNSIINTNTMFSFNNVQMFDVYKIDENKAFTFGAIPADEYGNVESVVIGMAFGDTRIAIATDDTMLGWDPGQSLLNIANTKTRYFNISRSKSIGDWNLNANMTYANAQGEGSYGYVKDVDTFHAFGFGADANYVIDNENSLNFSVTQPLRIESGALHFDGVIADMTPYGREIDYTMSYTTIVSKSSTFNLQLSYASDYNHYRSEDNAKVMAVYKGTW